MGRRLAISTILSIIFCFAQGQEYNNFRKRVINLNIDSVAFDTLSVIPNSFSVKSLEGEDIDAKAYIVYLPKALFFPSPELKAMFTEVSLEYRVFPMMIEREFFTRDYKKYLSPDSLMGRETERFPTGEPQESPFGNQIETNGSIMRGVRFGNNQNLSVNSSMNLTFSGDLGKELKIEGAISDQNIPLQPEGTTRRLEEFDRIYLKVYRDNFSVQAGDIEMRAGSNGGLMSFERRVQGLSYSGIFANESDTLMVTTALAVPKGKFARNQILGGEGNQGPYRLEGSNGEPFIIILSGSERVYVDGTLLTRGEDNHYTIDYNSAELSFTHRMPINRNSRIQVEFEYSERSYARFNTYASVENKSAKWQWHISAFTEQDSRNQPFDQQLTDEQKQHLSNIGDNLSLAILAQEDRVEYDPEKILYQKVDTTVDAITYAIYKHSNDPNLAEFKVYFTYMGPGKGSYIPDFGTANGRVYRWVKPVNGEQQGSYEPVRRLVTPQKKQMVQVGLSRLVGKGSFLKANYALSNTDLNTFSQLDNDDNIGHGVQLAFSQRLEVGENQSNVGFGADVHKTTKGFRSIDRFREVEFERNWSIEAPLSGSDEQMIGGWFEYNKPKEIFARVTGENFTMGQWYKGSRGGLSGWIRNSVLSSTWDGSLVQAEDTAVSSQFFRAKLELSRTQGFVTFKTIGELESSLAKSIGTDSLLDRSFTWFQLKTSIATPDTLREQIELSYLYREDFKPNQGEMLQVGDAHEVSVISKIIHEKAGNFLASIGYRVFNPNDSFFAQPNKNEKTALARIEYSNTLIRGLWMISSAYELGSGLEPDAEFYFVEVPAGQGVYSWIDYNGNAIRELNEFEIANFVDEARFIRINIPGSKMISIRNNAFSIRSILNPGSLLNKSNGIAKYLGKLSNHTSYRVQQKNRITNFWDSANPLVDDPTDTLITSMSANLNSSFAFNRTSRKFGVEYIFNQGISKSILANGFELRDLQSNRILLWLGIGKYILAKADGESFTNNSQSQYFTLRNYSIKGYNAQQSVKYLSSKQQSIELGFKLTSSTNDLSDENLLSKTLFIQSDFIFAGKGTIMGKGSYVSNRFSGDPNSSIAYEMMKGLQPGKNIIWEVGIKRRLSKLFELELGYNGRYLNNGKTIHSGTMQARALF